MGVAIKEASKDAAQPKRVVNDFNINVATVNGSGSQTSNLVLIRSLFKMGIPVTGKNMFPSNIQGLADLVPRAPEQGRLSGPPRRHRGHGLHESGDRGRGHGVRCCLAASSSMTTPCRLPTIARTSSSTRSRSSN